MDDSQISAYLELFDLPDAFSEAQLKEAYRDLVQVWHPDKHSHNERLRKKAEEKMKEINEAYEALQSGLVNGIFRFRRPLTGTGSHAPDTRTSGEHPPQAPRHSQPAEPAAHDHWPAGSGAQEPKSLRGNAFWFLLIGLMLLIVFAGPHGKKPSPPVAEDLAAPGGDTETPLFASIEASAALTNGTRGPISQALDSRYGFKELRFGASINETRRRSTPDRIITNGMNQLVMFWYGPGTNNKLGDLPLDSINASFFRGQLFKIEVGFSRNPAEIYEALQGLFGSSTASGSLTRDGAPLRADCWFGEKVFCAIVAPSNSDRRTGWDGIVLYDIALNENARQYAAAEPNRAAQLLSEDGFGEFRFGMTLKEFSRILRRPPTISESGVGQKEAAIVSPENRRLGRYPLSGVRASFFQEKLYRIDLDFELHQKEIYDGFVTRFPMATNEESWTRNGEKLRAKQFVSQRVTAVILAPRAASLPWDSIVLYDRQADERRHEFEQHAPERAAKDL